VRAILEAIRAIVCGEPAGGAPAALPASERFGWVVAPASRRIPAPRSTACSPRSYAAPPDR